VGDVVLEENCGAGTRFLPCVARPVSDGRECKSPHRRIDAAVIDVMPDDTTLATTVDNVGKQLLRRTRWSGRDILRM